MMESAHARHKRVLDIFLVRLEKQQLNRHPVWHPNKCRVTRALLLLLIYNIFLTLESASLLIPGDISILIDVFLSCVIDTHRHKQWHSDQGTGPSGQTVLLLPYLYDIPNCTMPTCLTRKPKYVVPPVTVNENLCAPIALPSTSAALAVT